MQVLKSDKLYKLLKTKIETLNYKYQVGTLTFK